MSKFLTAALFSTMFVSAIMLAVPACDRPGTDPEPEYLRLDDTPRWSNAGDRLVFYAPGYRDSIPGPVLYVVDTTGENLHKVAVGGAIGIWLPGDTQLVVMGVDFKLYTLDLRKDSLSLLCDCAFARFPELDPTGRYLYYEDAGVANGWATSIFRMDLTTRDTTHIVGGSYPVISPDGNRLLFERSNLLNCYDLTSDSEWVVFSPGFQAHSDWSPDGSEIIVGNVLREGYYRNLYKVKPNGSDRRYFMDGLSPQYSPSGHRIAVARFGSDKRTHIWLIDPDGGNPKQITF
ncbi:MAG: hypothetical protein P8181_17745 [bacterium]